MREGGREGGRESVCVGVFVTMVICAYRAPVAGDVLTTWIKSYFT